MKVSELEKKLAQGECAPVYLVLGAEEYSINQAQDGGQFLGQQACGGWHRAAGPL